MSCRDGDRRRSAVEVLPAAVRGGYAVLGVHGLLLLAGLDMTLWGPSLTPAQCLMGVGTYLVRWLFRQVDDE
jgi:hypothetical protein